MTTQRRQPISSRKDEEGRRFYTWNGRGVTEMFYSVTTIIDAGIPKYLVPWASKLVAELAYADVEQHGKRALQHWAKRGALYVEELRAAGMKLAKIDESPRGLALRYLKGEPDRIRDAAADKGSAVHEASEEFVLARVREGARLIVTSDSVPEFDPLIAPHMASFLAFLRERRPRYLATEATVYNRRESFAGTGDAFMEVLIKGRWVPLCVDYKSGRAVYPEVAIQCAAYAHGEFIGGADLRTEHPVPPVEGTAVLHLTPNGYHLRQLRYDEAVWRAFLYARETFRWAIEISKTALGDEIPADLEDALAASIEGVA